MLQSDKPEIMCTLTVQQILEDTGDSRSFLKQISQAGMRSVRINTAHLQGVKQLEALARKLKSTLPDIKILIDTKGPEMRTTAIVGDGEVCLDEGQSTTIVGDSDDGYTTRDIIRVNYPMLHAQVKAGDIVMIDDGKLRMRVDDVSGKDIGVTVITGGVLASRKGLAIKDVNVELPAVSGHDEMYIAYAATSPLIDIIAHSFVRSAADVSAVKAVMGNSKKPVIAKIENQQGIDNLEAIIGVSDGILIARGDLTASIGRENIPAAQSRIASATKAVAKPLYLATNILPSMMYDTRPSAVDIAGIETAVAQGVDIMLLTNETAVGRYPIETVRALAANL